MTLKRGQSPVLITINEVQNYTTVRVAIIIIIIGITMSL